MAGEPLLPRTPVTLLALSLPARVTRPAVIRAAAPHWLSHAESPAVGPPSRWLWPWRRAERTARGIALPGYVAHVECFEAEVCFWGSVADYTPSWLPCRESCLVWLADTASHGKEIWCSAAAPIRGRLKETWCLEWAQRRTVQKMANKSLKWASHEVWQIASWKFFPSLCKSKRWMCPQQERVYGNSKHQTILYIVKYSRREQIWK